MDLMSPGPLYLMREMGKMHTPLYNTTILLFTVHCGNKMEWSPIRSVNIPISLLLIIMVIAGFHTTSRKFKLQNY